MYYNQIIKFEQEGNTVKEIYSSIQNQGYTGTFSGVRTIIERFRKERKFGLSKEDKILISRKRLCSWMWRPEEQLEMEELSFLNICFELYPPVKELYSTIQTYRGAIQTKNLEIFLQGIREQISSKKNPFYYYALRLRSDLQAVKNALSSPFSNGLLEGQINRLKTIKRVTYGRAGLAILEKRVLYRL